MQLVKGLFLILPVIISLSLSAGVSEKEYHQVLDDILDVYGGELASDGIDFIIERRYEDTTVNAYARKVGNKIRVTVLGGISKAPEINKDVLALIVCHELGHFIGGNPDRQVAGNLVSVEGQADYFATSKCLKRYILYQEDISIPETTDAIKLGCSMIFTSIFEKNLCIRVANAGSKMSSFIAKTQGVLIPQVFTPDTTVVNENVKGFPPPQCRLDTYFAGALCDKAPDSNDFCTRDEGYQLGARPLCWFAPEI